MAEKVKVTVNVLRDDFEALQEMAVRKGTTFTEEVRRALALARLAEETEESGGKVLLEDPNGDIRQVIKL
ncbi:MAG: hypothetical protein ABSD97_17365 [Acidimicrobiales bacterium]|jgi:hypothetical protein